MDEQLAAVFVSDCLDLLRCRVLVNVVKDPEPADPQLPLGKGVRAQPLAIVGLNRGPVPELLVDALQDPSSIERPQGFQVVERFRRQPDLARGCS